MSAAPQVRIFSQAPIFIAAALAFAATAEAQQKKTAIVGAQIFDATGAAPYLGTVVVQNGVILSVTKGSKAPAGSEVIIAKGMALLPGLHDVHAHYFSIDRGRYNASEVNYAYASAGFTGVGDFSTGPESVAARRDWYASMPGPQVFFAGRIAPSEAKIWDWGDPATAYWVNTPGAAELAVKDIKAHGYNIIKAFTDGWRYGNTPDVAGMDEPTLTALVKEAKASSLPVFTHTLTLEKGKAAVRAGVSVIAHALQDKPVDAELIDLVKKGTTAYSPTLQTYEPVKPGDAPPANPDAGFKAREARFQLALDNVKALHDAGMMLVVGSDSGSSRSAHAISGQREMELLVKAGLTPSEVLMAGTINAAKALNQSNTGTIEAGKVADLVLIEGKPWQNISDVRKVARTFRAGETVYRKGQPKPPMPETPKAAPAKALIADFESADRRTNSGALVQIDLDRNGERSWEVLNLVPRADGGKALLATALMSQRSDPKAEIVIPLVKGGVQPVDASAFRGVSFDTRGAGDYTLALMTPAGAWTAPFKAGDAWSKAQVSFKDLTGPTADIGWTGMDVLAVRVVIQRPAGTSTWVELDNLKFE